MTAEECSTRLNSMQKTYEKRFKKLEQSHESKIKNCDDSTHNIDVNHLGKCSMCGGKYLVKHRIAREKELESMIQTLEQSHKAEFDRIAYHVIKSRDAHSENDFDEAYHHLYQIACPNFDRMIDDVWTELEKSAKHHKE